MATYKVIQDIEAEDKLLGPLSFRQFLYALIAVFLFYVSFLLYVHHAQLLDIVTMPVGLLAAFLAFPFGKDQPTEIWAVAKLRFFLKPRKRIWAQSGVKELVTITAPKKVEIQRTDGLSQNEVKSRLQALANTIDSRGWVVKNVNVTYNNPLMQVSDSDRLISTSSLPKIVPDDDLTPSDDWFDEQSSPIAQQVGELLEANDSQHRQQLLERLNGLRSSLRSGNQVSTAPSSGSVTSTSKAAADEVIEQQLKTAQNTGHAQLNNMHALRNQLDQAQVSAQAPAVQPPPKPTNPVIMNLSKRNDLNVSVISHEADKAVGKNPEEVLVSLH